jgi:hypothetical protein
MGPSYGLVGGSPQTKWWFCPDDIYNLVIRYKFALEINLMELSIKFRPSILVNDYQN